MKTEIKKRTFEASKFPKGSDERAKLNCDPLTSEYMTSYKYTLYIYKEQTVTSLPIIHTYNFRTKSDAMDKEKSIIDNPSYYEAK